MRQHRLTPSIIITAAAGLVVAQFIGGEDSLHADLLHVGVVQDHHGVAVRRHLLKGLVSLEHALQVLVLVGVQLLVSGRGGGSWTL